MRTLIAGALMAISVAASATAQTEQPRTSVPTPRSQGPFSSDWARPLPETGGYFYNDPRRQYDNQPTRPRLQSNCPSGRVYNPYTGLCQ
jgi:hypothetical protein